MPDTGQSDAAAERSAHVLRDAGPQIVGVHPVVEVSPGVWRLRAVVELERERDDLRTRVEQAERAVAGAVKARSEAIRRMGEASREAGVLRGKCDALEIERDAARAEGFAAGIEAAARIVDNNVEAVSLRDNSRFLVPRRGSLTATAYGPAIRALKEDPPQ